MSETVAGLSPSQTVGPYLSIGLLGDVVTPELVPRATADAILIRGRLLDGAGDPVPDGMIEIWQADPTGRFPEAGDAFTGFGRSGTVDEGRFELVTLKPGRVPHPDGGLQAPHLSVSVFARGLLKRLATRMYFPDEAAANEADPVLALLPPERRSTLVAVQADGFLQFDIRLQGPGETVFFAV
jgi:protocatechuate 3,4-dioxygenase alpha subunit